MFQRRIGQFLTLIAGFGIWAAPAKALSGTAFTYQGQLKFNGVVVTGDFDFRFILWDSDDGGNQVGPILTLTNIPVESGVFTAALDFGPVFVGPDRWLEIAVHRSTAPPGYQLLSPRQRVSPSPYSLGAGQAETSNGLTGRPVNAAAPAPGQLLRWDGVAWTPSDEVGATYTAGAGLSLVGSTFSIAPIGVATEMLADGAVTDAKVTNVSWGKITGAPASFPPTGPAGGDLAGTYPNPLLGNAVVSTPHLADLAVTTVKLADLGVTNGKLGDLAVSTGKLADLAVTSGKLAESAVSSAKLALDSSSLARVSDGLALVSGTNIGIGTASPSDKLTVAGVIQSNLGGFRFPDGTIQTTAVSVPAGGRTPQQIAQLRWYEGNQYPNRYSFSGGTYGGEGIAFDGDHMWVTQSAFNQLFKYRASDYTLVATYSTGADPVGVCCDGASIWVANSSSDTVTKRRANDGAVLGTFVVGDKPTEICFDGGNIWVVNELGDSISKLRASDGAVLGTYPVGDSPRGICFDGAYIWVSLPYPANAGVVKVRASDGAVIGTYPVGYYGPWGLCFDGANIWAAIPGSDSVVKVRASDGVLLGTYAAGDWPWSVCFDGTNIWVSNLVSGDVKKLRASDGALIGTYYIGTSLLLRRTAFDGANTWVVDWYGASKL
ncbi:MAG: hypothetical protein HZB38_00740 [Planctomycetes bacterium]|nr:hypothetical protein [Planctomycetota bacterium]